MLWIRESYKSHTQRRASLSLIVLEINRPQIWIFGLIERGSSKVRMFRVPQRNAATLLPLIEANVAPQTLIVSDGWASYGGIKNLQSGNDHLWVNHQTHFVDPKDRRVHTQSIEASWGALKKKLKAYNGIPQNRLLGYLYNYMFRRFFDNKKILNHLIVEMNYYRREIGTPPPQPVIPAVVPPQPVINAVLPVSPRKMRPRMPVHSPSPKRKINRQRAQIRPNSPPTKPRGGKHAQPPTTVPNKGKKGGRPPKRPAASSGTSAQVGRSRIVKARKN